MDLFKKYVSRVLLDYAVSSFVQEDIDFDLLLGKGARKLTLVRKRVNELLANHAFVLWEGELAGVKLEVGLGERRIGLYVQEARLSLCHNTFPSHFQVLLQQTPGLQAAGKKLSSEDKGFLDGIVRGYVVEVFVEKLSLRFLTENPTRRGSHWDAELSKLKVVKERISSPSLDFHLTVSLEDLRLKLFDFDGAKATVLDLAVESSHLEGSSFLPCLKFDFKSLKDANKQDKAVVRFWLGQVRAIATKPLLLILPRVLQRLNRASLNDTFYNVIYNKTAQDAPTICWLDLELQAESLSLCLLNRLVEAPSVKQHSLSCDGLEARYEDMNDDYLLFVLDSLLCSSAPAQHKYLLTTKGFAATCFEQVSDLSMIRTDSRSSAAENLRIPEQMDPGFQCASDDCMFVSVRESKWNVSKLLRCRFQDALEVHVDRLQNRVSLHLPVSAPVVVEVELAMAKRFLELDELTDWLLDFQRKLDSERNQCANPSLKAQENAALYAGTPVSEIIELYLNALLKRIDSIVEEQDCWLFKWSVSMREVFIRYSVSCMQPESLTVRLSNLSLSSDESLEVSLAGATVHLELDSLQSNSSSSLLTYEGNEKDGIIVSRKDLVIFAHKLTASISVRRLETLQLLVQQSTECIALDWSNALRVFNHLSAALESLDATYSHFPEETAVHLALDRRLASKAPGDKDLLIKLTSARVELEDETGEVKAFRRSPHSKLSEEETSEWFVVKQQGLMSLAAEMKTFEETRASLVEQSLPALLVCDLHELLVVQTQAEPDSLFACLRTVVLQDKLTHLDFCQSPLAYPVSCFSLSNAIHRTTTPFLAGLSLQTGVPQLKAEAKSLLAGHLSVGCFLVVNSDLRNHVHNLIFSSAAVVFEDRARPELLYTFGVFSQLCGAIQAVLEAGQRRDPQASSVAPQGPAAAEAKVFLKSLNLDYRCGESYCGLLSVSDCNATVKAGVSQATVRRLAGYVSNEVNSHKVFYYDVDQCYARLFQLAGLRLEQSAGCLRVALQSEGEGLDSEVCITREALACLQCVLDDLSTKEDPQDCFDVDADRSEGEEEEEFTVVDRFMHEIRKVVDAVESKAGFLQNHTSRFEVEVDSLAVYLCVSKNDTRSKSVQLKASGLHLLFEELEQQETRTCVYSATCSELCVLDNHQTSIFKYVLECSHRPLNFYLSFREQRHSNRFQQFPVFRKVASGGKAPLIELTDAPKPAGPEPRLARRLA